MNKKIYTSCVFLLLGLVRSVFSLQPEEPTKVSTELSEMIQQFSRREGYQIAKEMKNNAEWIDFPSVFQGMQEYISGKPIEKGIESQLNNDFYGIALQLFELEASNNLEKALSFLQMLSKNPKLHSLENGKVMYEIVREGNDPALVKKDSSPLLHYTVSTQNGLEIINTRETKTACKVSLNETVPGFAKGIEGMRIGERRKIYIHPDLGYGKTGCVPPNSLLVVDVEVVSCVDD
jgi:peptidylprolyl isomerase